MMRVDLVLVLICTGVMIPSMASFDSESIGHGGPEQWRWLSVPKSRLVLNPSLITERSTPLCTALALHAGYYAGPTPMRLQHLAEIRVLDGPDRAETTETWRHRLEPGRDWAAAETSWTFQGATAATAEGSGTLSVIEGGDPWGFGSYTVTPPFQARSGYLRVHVPHVDGAWALKIGHDELAVDVSVQRDTEQTGVYTYTLDQVAGWRGRDSFDIKFFAVGSGARARLASVEIELTTDDPNRGKASSVASTWYPHQLNFEAQYNETQTALSGTDFFYDAHRIVRLLDLSTRNGQAATLVFSGRPYGMRQPQIEEAGTLVFDNEDFGYALRVLRREEKGRYLPMAFEAYERGFQWHATIPEIAHDTRLALVAAFVPKTDGGGEEALRYVMETMHIDEQRAARKEEWDTLLAKAPMPDRFGIQAIDAKGVTAADHRRAYYAAWAFVIQNVLPPMPENSFAHRQTPTGKPSLWAEGASRARASAAWESFFAQQLLVQIAPETAWDAFLGLMLQVDDAGWLDGEVLPSRKAQTAWVLYHHTSDRTRLQQVYPPISRYLRWREKNPRWIYGDHDNPAQRDSNFVDSLLLDLNYAVRIAEILDEDTDEWHAMRERVLKDYVDWFFPDDHPHPVQYYYKDTGEHDQGHATWVCSGLYLDGLPEDAEAALLGLFRSMFDPDHDLAGLDFCKHPIASMIVHGLRRMGLDEEARNYQQAVLRDVIRATRFSENYSFDPLRSWGVEDSMFGAATIIEFTLLDQPA